MITKHKLVSKEPGPVHTALVVTHVDGTVERFPVTGTVERFPVTGTVRIKRPGERDDAEAPGS